MRPGRSVAVQQRRRRLPDPGTSARSAAVLFRRRRQAARGERRLPRRGRVQRAGRRGHVPHRHAADGAGWWPRPVYRSRSRLRRRFVAAVVHAAYAAATDHESRWRRGQRVFPLSPGAVSFAHRLRRHKSERTFNL